MEASALPQHMAALNKANSIRLERAAIKREIGRGERDITDVLEHVPWCCETMRVSELVGAQHRWGRHRTRKLLGHLAIGENRALGDLTLRQRALLIAELGR